MADSDDRVAADLTLMNRIKQLEEQLADLRVRIAQQQTALSVAAPTSGIEDTPDTMPWLIGGALALLGLSGTILWRRRRITAATDQSESERWAISAADPAVPDQAAMLACLELPVTPDDDLRPESKAAETPSIAQRGSGAAPAVSGLAAAAAVDPDITGERIVFSIPDAAPRRSPQEEYYAGRFGGPSQDVRSLKNLENVIEQARSIYQDDGNAIKAADLLELTVSLRPDVIGPWLALFAIYRRESMTQQFAKLAVKFNARYALDPNWARVQRLGREIDADNPLYCESAPAAASAPSAASTDQPDVTDEWLGIALDFSSSPLADELRDRLLKGAAVPALPLAANAT
jgi:hypothetical protein